MSVKRWEKRTVASFVLYARGRAGRRSLIRLDRIPLPPSNDREAHHKYLDLYMMYTALIGVVAGEELKIKK